ELLDELAFHSTNRFPTYDQRVKDILEYIHQHYQEKINLQTLAEIANLSKSEANRLFKKHVGRTPFTYILDYRLERSINLLTGTRSSITDISFECGFSSVSYFIENSRKHFISRQNNLEIKKIRKVRQFISIIHLNIRTMLKASSKSY